MSVKSPKPINSTKSFNPKKRKREDVPEKDDELGRLLGKKRHLGPKKLKKISDWKKKMSNEKQNRLDSTKQTLKKKEKIVPGQNWLQLKPSVSTENGKRFLKNKQKSEPIIPAPSESNSTTPSISKSSSTIGWNTNNKEKTPVVSIAFKTQDFEGGKSITHLSIVNFLGGILYDSAVNPMNTSADSSNIVQGSKDVTIINREIFPILQNRIVIGNHLNFGFKQLLLNHPKIYTRDLLMCPALRTHGVNAKSGLVEIAKAVQVESSLVSEPHNSIDNARLLMLIYRKLQVQWEEVVKNSCKHLSTYNPVAKIVEQAQRIASKQSQSSESNAMKDVKEESSSSGSEEESNTDSEESDSWASSSSESGDSEEESSE